MIKRAHLLSGAALAAAFMLGSCGGGGGAVVAMEPGEWEWTMRVANVRLDNMPPEMREEMSRMRTNESRTTRDCMTVTADVVRIQNLRFTIPAIGRSGGSCRIAELSMESGRIRAEMSCEGMPAGPMAGPQTMAMSGEMNGSYTPRGLDVTGRGEVRVGARNGSAEMRISGRRIGACPPPRPYMPPVYTPQSPPVMVPRPMPGIDAPPAPVPPGNRAGNAL